MTQAKKQREPTVAITGAGSGLGRELAFGFSAKGYRVFGTTHSSNEITEFQNHSAAAKIILTFTDITKEEQVNNWKEQVRKIINRDGLDLLINNAGISTPGPMEVLSLTAIRHEFEVNVFGSLTTIHAFLPLLRKAGYIPAFGGDVPINYALYGMQKLAQNVTGIKVPLSGHWIPEERPNFVVYMLNNFFDGAKVNK